MPTIKQLKTSDGTNESFFPITKEKAIYDENGIRLDNKLSSIKCDIYPITLVTSSWSASAPYTQTITIEGMTSDWVPNVPVLVSTGDQDADTAMQKANSNISKIESSNGYLTFTCFDACPTVDINLKIMGKRDI